MAESGTPPPWQIPYFNIVCIVDSEGSSRLFSEEALAFDKLS